MRNERRVTYRISTTPGMDDGLGTDGQHRPFMRTGTAIHSGRIKRSRYFPLSKSVYARRSGQIPKRPAPDLNEYVTVSLDELFTYCSPGLHIYALHLICQNGPGHASHARPRPRLAFGATRIADISDGTLAPRLLLHARHAVRPLTIPIWTAGAPSAKKRHKIFSRSAH